MNDQNRFIGRRVMMHRNARRPPRQHADHCYDDRTQYQCDQDRTGDDRVKAADAKNFQRAQAYTDQKKSRQCRQDFSGIIRFEHGIPKSIMSRETFSTVVDLLHREEYELALERFDATAYQRDLILGA